MDIDIIKTAHDHCLGTRSNAICVDVWMSDSLTHHAYCLPVLCHEQHIKKQQLTLFLTSYESQGHRLKDNKDMSEKQDVSV